MDVAKIKELISTNPEYTVGALISLYKQQTNKEQNTHSTRNKNNFGFNALDAGILSDLSRYYLNKQYLSVNQVRLARTKLMKYVKQLSVIGVTPLKITQIPQVTKEKKLEKIVEKTVEKLTDEKVKVIFPFDMTIVNQIKAIPGRSFDMKDKFWSVPMTLRNIEYLQSLGFALTDELSEWYTKQTDGLTSDISIPGLDKKLRPFQKLAVSFIESKNGRALIADEMGLGKTAEAIAWIVYKGTSVFPVLIACPATLKLNWEIEINKWSTFGKNVEILSGTKPYKIKKQIAIINYDILFDWMPHIIKEFKPTLVIYDEQHLGKSRGSGFKKINGEKKKVVLVQRSYAMEEIAKKTKYCIGLTGTPILNKPVEIFNLIKMISPRVFPTFSSFAYRYCDPKNNGFGIDFSGASNVTELSQILSREVMIRRKKEDVLKELPAKTFTFQYFELGNRKEYDKAESDFIKYLKEYNPDKVKKAKRAEVLTQINHLRKLAVIGKLKQSIQWISDFIESEKLIVFAFHKEIIQQLQKAFPNSVTVDGSIKNEARQKAVDDFQNKNIPLFIGQIQAAGVGLTLTAASNSAFLQMPWGPGEYLQCCDRNVRIGQKNAVTIWNLVAKNSIDDTFSELIESKARVINSIIDGAEINDAGVFDDLILKLKNK